MTTNICDIAIVGGGPVGGLAACTLARAGYAVTLFERGAPPAPDAHAKDTRGYALAAGSVQLLDDLGYWAPLAERATAIRSIVVSRRGGLGRVHLNAADHGRHALGQVVPAVALEPMLDAACRDAGVDVRHHSTLAGVGEVTDDQRALRIRGADGESTWAARLILAADGIQSPTRKALGLPVNRLRYAADALVFDVLPARPHNGQAFERFTDEGPLALLPQADGRMNVVWVAPPQTCERRLELDEAERLRELQARFGWTLGRLRPAGRVVRFPLERVHAPEPVADRALLLGNAAHAVHPVAGQGLNLALRDVATLLGALREACGQGGAPGFVADPGAPATLAAYARARRADVNGVVAATDFLARGMLHAAGLRGHALGGGMMAIDRLRPARDRLAQAAMGLGPLPRHTARHLARPAAGGGA
ncbi:FAD-dependent monooxygenase [Thioalkalivibrio sp. AKL19]|uniref:FAD-dependent monooxygenase n=1 Tax=Thioalkalivibrio sp. AKL19 TaxID=1266914 RepID=UPI000400AC63|nr:FAD-dependent monooxygenase [Thioalkalivibrio sp. AKL19]